MWKDQELSGQWECRKFRWKLYISSSKPQNRPFFSPEFLQIFPKNTLKSCRSRRRSRRPRRPRPLRLGRRRQRRGAVPGRHRGGGFGHPGLVGHRFLEILGVFLWLVYGNIMNISWININMSYNDIYLMDFLDPSSHGVTERLSGL